MRIMMVCDHFPDYGTKSVMTLAEALAAHGHKVLVASTSVGLNGHRFPADSPSDYAITRFTSVPIPGFPYSYTPLAGGNLIDAARQFKPDVIHAHFVMYWLTQASSVLAREGYPLVLSVHGFTFPSEITNIIARAALKSLYMTRTRQLVESASRIICVSDEVRKRLGMVYPRCVRSARVVHFGVGADMLLTSVMRDRDSVRGTVGLGNKFTFIFLGRIVPEKGVLELLRAFRMLRANRDNVALLFVGEGSMMNTLRRYENVTKDVHVLGFHRDVGTYLSASDAFVLPSYREGFPTSLVEATFFGLPFIATPVGGISDLLAMGCVGEVVPVGDHESLFRAMNKMTDLGSRASILGAKNREIARSRLTWASALEKHLETYNDAAGT